MKRLQTMMLFGILSIGAAPLMAASGSLNEFTPKVMPVLIQVNSHGKVTSVSPSIRLTPKLNRLLRQNLDEMITKPATAQGRAVASQFVMNMTLHAAPTDEGKYDVQFGYASTSPVPPGEWYWAHIDGHRLVLVNAKQRDDAGRYHNQSLYRNPAAPVRSFTPPYRSPSPASSAPASTPKSTK